LNAFRASDARGLIDPSDHRRRGHHPEVRIDRFRRTVQQRGQGFRSGVSARWALIDVRSAFCKRGCVRFAARERAAAALRLRKLVIDALDQFRGVESAPRAAMRLASRDNPAKLMMTPTATIAVIRAEDQ
jgi:hypothetical protein